jgi:hypothetical protein
VAWLAVAPLAARPQRADAQIMAGRLRDSSGVAVREALVLLIDSVGREVARTTSLGSGAFSLRAPAPGLYSLRVLRIGHRAWQMPALRLEQNETRPTTAIVPNLTVQLPDLVVTSERSQCRVRPEARTTAALLIEEARKGLLVAEGTMARSELVFRTHTYDVELSATLETQTGARLQSTSLRAWPVESAPVDSIARHGFVRQPSPGAPAIGPNAGPIYFAPDGTVLFSDWFLATHCFEPSTAPDSLDRVALHFRPAGESGRPDIEGTLWLDAASLSLRALEFRYVRLPRWVPRHSAGGALHFTRLLEGGLAITGWWLRAPIAQVPVGRAPRLTRLAGYRESGGGVTEILERSGAVVVTLSPPAPPRDSVAPGDPPEAAPATPGTPGRGETVIRVVQHELPGAAGRSISASNLGESAVTITALRLRSCDNVTTRCGTHRLNLDLGPGQTVEVMSVRPRRLGEAYSFRASVDWRESP